MRRIELSKVYALTTGREFSWIEEPRGVEIFQVTTDEEVLKKIFCLHEDEQYYGPEEAESLKHQFENGGVEFGDNGYDKNVQVGDFIVVVDKPYSYPITTIDEMKVMFALLGDSKAVMRVHAVEGLTIDQVPPSIRYGQSEEEIIENHKRYLLTEWCSTDL